MAAYLPLRKIVGFLFFFFLLVFTFSSWLQVVTVTCLQTTTVWLQSLSDRLLKVCKSLPTNFKMWTDCQRVAISQSQLAQHASLCMAQLKRLYSCFLFKPMSFWLDLQANVKFHLVQFLLCMQTTADLWFLFYLSQLIALSAQTDTCLRNRGPQLAKWGRLQELPHWLNFHPWKLLLGIKFVSEPVTWKKNKQKQTPNPIDFI